MNIKTRVIAIIAFITLFGQLKLSAQDGNFEISAFAQYSIDLDNSSNFTNNNFYGLGLDLDYIFNNKISLLTRTTLNFGGYDPESFVTICLGPKYHIALSEGFSIDPFIGLGISGILGNDFAFISGAFNGGVKINLPILEPGTVFIGAAFKQAMSFHPSHIEFIEFSAGVRF